jgi:hypothetical protein
MIQVKAALCAALFATCFCSIVLPATAAAPTALPFDVMARADLPRDSEWINPFCDASAVLIPWNKDRNASVEGPSDTFALFVWAHAKSNYAARVTLVADGDAYSVTLPRTAIGSAPAGTFAKTAYLVSIDHYIDVGEYFVDGVGVDGAQVGDCPSFVKGVAPLGQFGADLSTPVPAFTRVNGVYAQALPKLTCASPYTQADTLKPYSPLVGYYGDHTRSAEVEVFVDSAGGVVKTTIWRSSGVDGLDAAALGAAQFSTYRAAQFLCTPVVSSEFVEVKYKP